MLHVFDFIRDITFLSVLIRLTLAVICGGIIGIEREYKRRPAGFRTHILICLGAAMTTMTSQYLYLNMHLFTDIARLGAQVIAGIGFIGAGSIIVTKRERVKGLTTAAGLWTSSIVGLACGVGYVECALFATVMILFAEIFLARIEFRLARTVKDVNLYVEYNHTACLESIVRVIKDTDIHLNDLETNRITRDGDEHFYCAILAIQATRKQIEGSLLDNIKNIDDIISVQEI